MTSDTFSTLIDEVGKRQSMIQEYLFDQDTRISFTYKHLEDAVYSYVNAGGKSLRAAVLMFCCGAVGGDEQTAIPAAAAVELYHTFTLVHDDIIDRDEMRRGVASVHFDFARRAREELRFDSRTAEHYGLSIAILAGDMQQGWAASLLPDLYHRFGVPPELALNLIVELFRHTQIALINGETIDILQAETPVDQLTEAQVIEMLRQKTGILYEFAGRAGAAIGLREPDLRHSTIEAVAAFTGMCGTAFQIQDDILGITGSEQRLGKPVGSDIREGKRTIIVLHSLQNMTAAQRSFTLNILGNPEASLADVQEVIELLRAAGGVDHARNVARDYVHEALPYLDALPASEYTALLRAWAAFITERDQ
jgi:geranylgeranyl diphosphate synthase, type I